MPKNNTKPWTPAHIAHMRRLAKKRVSARVAASKLGRSPGATRYAAMVHGVSFKSINRAAA